MAEDDAGEQLEQWRIDQLKLLEERCAAHDDFMAQQDTYNESMLRWCREMKTGFERLRDILAMAGAGIASVQGESLSEPPEPPELPTRIADS